MDLGKSRTASIGAARRPVRAAFGGLLVGLLGCSAPESTVEPLSGLTYSANPAVYTKGTAITPNVPTSLGGLASSYAVSPALPSGLSLDASSGVISGTPDTVSPATDYVVTASNPKGSAAVVLNITVHDLATVAPSGLSYATNPAVYTKGVAVAPNMPTNGGGAVVSYAVSPSLSAGLSLNRSTGVISGTPSTIAATANYTVTATNLGGNTATVLALTVNDAPPSNLAYLNNPAAYTKGTAIVPNTPTSTGGAVVSYSVSPVLPVGLSLDPGAGAIYGTPSALTANALYTVTASNSGGDTKAILSVTVNDVPPSSLKYARNPAVYPKGETITPNVPTSSGGQVVSYSVSPSLPAGLSLDTSTGAVYGTPSVLTDAASYTVTATNSGGSTMVGLSIAVGVNQGWSLKTDSASWAARGGFGTVQFNGNTWLFGGSRGPGNLANDVWYSSDMVNWTMATGAAPWATRYWHMSAAYDGKMWVMGGGFVGTFAAYNDVWHSTNGVDWTQATGSAAWSRRQGGGLVVFNDKIWLLGGVASEGGWVYKNDVWSSTNGADWTKVTNAAPWGARASGAVFVFDGKMWIAGGWNGSAALSDVWFSADGLSWNCATDSAPWGPRGFMPPAVYGNKMWVIGGYSGSAVKRDVWYSTDGGDWIQSPDAPWSARYEHGVAEVGGKMWVWGGGPGSYSYLNDVWSFSSIP